MAAACLSNLKTAKSKQGSLRCLLLCVRACMRVWCVWLWRLFSEYKWYFFSIKKWGNEACPTLLVSALRICVPQFCSPGVIPSTGIHTKSVVWLGGSFPFSFLSSNFFSAQQECSLGVQGDQCDQCTPTLSSSTRKSKWVRHSNPSNKNSVVYV